MLSRALLQPDDRPDLARGYVPTYILGPLIDIASWMLRILEAAELTGLGCFIACRNPGR